MRKPYTYEGLINDETFSTYGGVYYEEALAGTKYQVKRRIIYSGITIFA